MINLSVYLSVYIKFKNKLKAHKVQKIYDYN